jgi:BirA family biotin operon repressor/biotin-[acetyl-CoA-carboxylase] ligase
MESDAKIGPLSLAEIQPLLRTRMLGRVLHYHETVDSTNRIALALAAEKAPDGTVVVAETQSAGRGRLGRVWHSPPHVNLYCSIVLRPCTATTDRAAWLCWLPLVAGLAVIHSVHRTTGLMPSLKWPNDVFVNSRKVAGILCESHLGRTPLDQVVIGIGINVNAGNEDFPPDIAVHATSLACELGQPCSRPRLLAALLNELEERVNALAAGVTPSIVEEYSTRCSTLNRKIQVALASGEVLTGIAEAITEQGALVLARPQVHRSTVLYAGDVVHVR